MLSDYNGIEIEISNRKFSGKFPNIWKLTNELLNNTWSKSGLKGI